jgi:predicted 2-oxoglutarate/Fe(II)-dependent dioxygenase YbiX
MNQFKKLTEDFFIGNLGCKESTDEVAAVLETSELFDEIEYEDAGVGSSEDGVTDYGVRKCEVKWLSVDNVNFIETGLRSIVENVNDSTWKIDLDHKWQTSIQYTRYTERGHFYGWHQDYYDYDDQSLSEIRRISIVYCLCHKSDYVGGEFQIKTSNGNTYTRKLDYGDFIVFPSDRVHRVKKLKGGERTTLVGWYY